MSETGLLESEPLPCTPEQEIQAFGEIRNMPIALSIETRRENVALINRITADSMVLHSLYKKHHWLMRGPMFYQLHLLFDKHAGEQEDIIDRLAERVQSLGGVAVADPRHVAELTAILRPPNGVESVAAMLSRLLATHEAMIAVIRTAIEQTATNLDWSSNDLLVGDVLRIHEEQVWFIAERLTERA